MKLLLKRDTKQVLFATDNALDIESLETPGMGFDRFTSEEIELVDYAGELPENPTQYKLEDGALIAL